MISENSYRTPHEEAQLIERFGNEYRSYMLRTGRYFPRFLSSPRGDHA